MTYAGTAGATSKDNSPDQLRPEDEYFCWNLEHIGQFPNHLNDTDWSCLLNWFYLQPARSFRDACLTSVSEQVFFVCTTESHSQS